MAITPNECHPPLLLRNRFLQSLLASKNIRSWGVNPVRIHAQEKTLTIGNHIRLQAYYSPSSASTPKGIVIFLHGWEGSAESSYILTTSQFLYQKGYAIFRLNFRDHGTSHRLNRGLFYASNLDEVFQTVRMATQINTDWPAFLIGFSLGGNFALRIGKKLRHEPIHPLKHIVAISPVLNPDKTTSIIDQMPVIRLYFLKKWRRSLMIKQNLYPDYYRFEKVFNIDTIRGTTNYIVNNYSNYENTQSYFDTYTIDKYQVESIRIPTTVITSVDDPIIPFDDFDQLRPNNSLQLAIQHYGGHNGFINRWSLGSWYAPRIARLFDEIVQLKLHNKEYTNEP